MVGENLDVGEPGVLPLEESNGYVFVLDVPHHRVPAARGLLQMVLLLEQPLLGGGGAAIHRVQKYHIGVMSLQVHH